MTTYLLIGLAKFTKKYILWCIAIDIFRLLWVKWQLCETYGAIMENKRKKQQLSVFLVKDTVKQYSEIYKQHPSWHVYDVPIGDSVGWLIAKKPKSNPPVWASFFQQHFDIRSLGYNSSTGAIFVIKSKNRFFVLSFGVGHHLLKADNIENNFGLRASLNCIDENCIRCVDKSSLEAHPKESREQSSNITDLQFFGIDVERDLLKAVTGSIKKEYEKLGSRITGRDQVQFSSYVCLDNLFEYLDVLLDAYNSSSYKDGAFSWVDHIGEVKNSFIVNKLENDLICRLKNNDFNRVWLSVPEIVDWERTIGFKYISRSDSIRHDVRLSSFIEYIYNNKHELSLDVLKNKKIYSVNSNHDVIKGWPSYRFIYAECDYKDGSYLLNNGRWYEIDRNYASSIVDYYDNLKFMEHDLPEYDHQSETAYNKYVATINSECYYLLDSKNIKINTSVSPVEPCDLFRYPDTFIHIKRYGGSTVLSHLFNQGLVSGELFKREKEFRVKLKEKFGHEESKTLIDNFNHKFNLVYAIISEQCDGLSIPFFSKISLKHAVSRLEALGYNVRIAKIKVSERIIKTKICKTPKMVNFNGSN